MGEVLNFPEISHYLACPECGSKAFKVERPKDQEFFLVFHCTFCPASLAIPVEEIKEAIENGHG